MPELKHNLRVEPYPYQRDGILFGLQKKRLIIGDEPTWKNLAEHRYCRLRQRLPLFGYLPSIVENKLATRV